MTYLIVSSVFAVLMTLANAQSPSAQVRSTSTEKVRGVMVLHSQYPHFVQQDSSRERVFEIDIRDQKWSTKYFYTLKPETILETPSFCIEAEGYEDRTRLGPTDRTTFVFTAIKSTKLVKSGDECVQDTRKP